VSSGGTDSLEISGSILAIPTDRQLKTTMPKGGGGLRPLWALRDFFGYLESSWCATSLVIATWIHG